MKKFSFEFIKKVDYVLVFIFAVISIIGICISLIISVIPVRPSIRNDLPVIENSNKETKEITDFYTKLNDVYVFEVRSSGIKSEDFSEAKKRAKSTSLYVDKDAESGGLINLLFVKDDKETALFDSKVFIYRYELQNLNDKNVKEFHDCNVYAVIKSDTNSDKSLNIKDDIALYFSKYDGTGLIKVSDSIITLEATDKNEFMFTEHDGTNMNYYIYNYDKKSTKLIKSVVQESGSKHIRIY